MLILPGFSRRFRAIPLLLAVIGVTAVASVTGLTAQCVPGICEEFDPVPASAIVQLPGYPGCDVKIGYTYRLCPPPFGLTFIEVQEFSVIGGSPECDALKNHLFPGGNPNWSAIKWAFQEGYNTLVRKLFTDAFLSDPYAYDCPGGEVSYTSVWRSCAQILVSNSISPFQWRVRIRSCQDDVCCFQETKVCYNTVTETIEETHTWIYTYFYECGYPPPPPTGTLFASGCLEWCLE